MKQSKTAFLTAAAGAALLVIGLLLIKTLAEPLPYVLIGLGCGIFGHGTGTIISRWALKGDPGLQKQLEIEQNDERSVAIANRSKAKAYDMMIYVFGALMLSFALMEVEMAAILLFVSGYLLVQGYGIYFRFRYDKEM